MPPNRFRKREGMSNVFPFRALRPTALFADQVASLPYDVMNVEEAKERVWDKPLNFLHVEKSEIDFPSTNGVEDSRVYERAKENLEGLVRQRILVAEDGAAFYLYRQRMGEHVQTGLVACVAIEEYERGRIRKHEFTRSDKERERTLHIDTVGAQTGPILMTYRKREEIDRLVRGVVERTPEFDFTADDDIAHTVWILRDSAEILKFREEFAPVEALYIADGHHRAAAAAAVARLRRERNPNDRGNEPYHFMLAVLYPHDQLRIMDYNRAVRDLNGLSEAMFLERVGEGFDVVDRFHDKSPRQRHEFGMYLGGRWRRLIARSRIIRNDDPIARLDVTVLQENLLMPILGVSDPRTDSRIEFVGGIRGMGELERLVDRSGFAVAFSLYPPSVGEMMAVADTGRVMPPKSTWFEPKLRSGLFVHRLE